MSDTVQDQAGPSNSPARNDPNLLRQFVMEYLQQHGFDKALEQFKAGLALDGTNPPNDDATNTNRRQSAGKEAIFRAPEPVSLESVLKRNIPQAQSVSASTLSDKITDDFRAQAMYIIEQLMKRVEASVGDDEGEATKGEKKKGDGDLDALLDPSDRVEGYRRYRRWVDGVLELWREELDGISYPLFVHTFLDMLHFGFTRSAREFFQAFRGPFQVSHPTDLSTLSGITDKSQIPLNPLCQRLLNEKYTVPMSRNPHGLLLQWLSGAGLDEEWESGRHSAAGRAKDAVKGIIVNRIDISVANTSTPLDTITLTSSTGLISSLIPRKQTLSSFNTTHPTVLKLGPPPTTDKLKEQVSRTLQDQDQERERRDTNGDINMDDPAAPVPTPLKIEHTEIGDRDLDLISPGEGETNPPVPAVFRIADLKREVEAVRDKRKMIRLGPGGEDGKGGAPGSMALPSVVAFTMFDNGEGVSSVEFSPDSSLMAVGSSESCIRIWSTKGEKLSSRVLDPNTGNLSTTPGLPHRKLIAHSGPVYSLSFDPLHGTSSPPQALLSSSQDGTIRLWSTDTWTNLVVYRGHTRDAVWDVQWGPLGTYFASGSRDRTARLWSTDRVTALRMYTGHLGDVNCVRFHPNSLYLATGSSDNSCRLWDVQRGACIRLFLGHTDAVTTMAVSPDGRMLASAGLDSSIWLWDLASSRPLKRMTGHKGPISSLSFSAESSLLVSGGLDATVRCWDVKSAGGERTRSGMSGDERRMNGGEGDWSGEKGSLPMGEGEKGWDEGNSSTSDLLSTWYTKRTPIVKTWYTPRNLCMVAGTFVPPSNGKGEGV